MYELTFEEIMLLSKMIAYSLGGKSGITAHPSRRDGMLFRFSGMMPDNN